MCKVQTLKNVTFRHNWIKIWLNFVKRMQELVSFSDFQEVLGLSSEGNQPYILFFGAEFYAPSQKGGQVYEIIEAMSAKYVNVKFYW